jgi:hypothetical protein
MRLTAAMIQKNELSRYLPLTIASLLEFCDDVRVIDDFSTDGSYEWLLKREGVNVLTNPSVTFDEHEGKARQALLDWVRESEPTHVIAIDADEFVTYGKEMRALLERYPEQGLFSLEMREIWQAEDELLWVRQDGGWRAHPVPVLWRPTDDPSWWTIKDRALACGREPEGIVGSKAIATGQSILHFGWTNLSERQRRYDRYMSIDGGAFHASTHLRSIMWPARKVRLSRMQWPAGLDREAVLERTSEERP